jgi:NADPH:quinone reductase-like Zn-dependent oxidoreductase
VGIVHLVEEPIPARGSADLLVRVHAVSLNYKDAAIIDNQLPWLGRKGGIAGTEFSGEVVEAGADVVGLQVGDRIVSLINFEEITGRETTTKSMGQTADGSLAEYLVVPAKSVVKIPTHLTWHEASMIACAGLTAWSALSMNNTRLAGKTILLQGTGGVSMIALLLAVKAGATVIVTSSSDDKLERAKALGASGLINYITTPDWEKEALTLTAQPVFGCTGSSP